MNSHIVLADPTYTIPRGTVLDDQNRRAHEASKRIVTLPYRKDFEREHALAALQERFWGEGLFLGDGNRITRVAPACLYLVPSTTARRVYWAARLTFEHGPEPIRGNLQLVTDNRALPNVTSLGSGAAVDLSTMGPPDEKGTWYVKGWAPVGADRPGFLSMCLSGQSPNVGVMWLAVSQAE